jgi:adenine-specific DNA-methyltransferase
MSDKQNLAKIKSIKEEIHNLIGNIDSKTSLDELQSDLERLKNYKKYGLVWENKPEAIEDKLKTHIPILKKVEDKTIHNDDKSPANILIKGDNYHALQVLNYTHKGKIDVIYIDPPYNTGNKDFVYNDKFIDKDDEFRHSTWLSFMEKRLKLAKNLLTEDGVIFISIDDNEQAQLKLLCDDVFGGKNFIGNIAWESKTKSQNTKSAFNKLQPKIEHIYCYSNNNKRKFNLYVSSEKEYLEKDANGIFRYSQIEQMDASGMRGRESMVFTICGISPKQEKQWKIGEDLINTFEKRGDLILIKGIPYLKMRPFDERTEKTIPFWAFLPKDTGTAESGKKELTDIVGKGHSFETVKPLDVVSKLLFHSTNKNTTILDFFAGSGTTAHAVLELNKADNGNRKFILCTDNGKQEKGSIKIFDEVCYPRVSKVMQGYTTPKGIEIDGLGGNVEVYKTDFVESSTKKINPNNKLNFKRLNDEDKIELSHKAGNMIAIKEDTIIFQTSNEWYEIYHNYDKSKFCAIYFKEDLQEFKKLIKEIGGVQCVVYVFSYDSLSQNSFGGLKNITIKDIPKPILDIYQTINR